jgi:hypothetical protein
VGLRHLALTLCVMSCSCAHDLAHASAGATGCAPKQMQISEVALSWSTTSWRVRCHGLAFRCTGEGTATCAPEPVAAPTTVLR